MTLDSLDARALARHGLLERYRADGSRSWLEAAGSSMHPMLPAGTHLLVEFGRAPERIGEVVLFRRGEGLVAHRFVARRTVDGRATFIAKGDGEALADPPIDPGAVLGVVCEARLRDGRAAPGPLGGLRGELLAHVSWWCGRTGRASARAARRAPAPVHRLVAITALSLSRVPTRVVMALIPRLERGASAEGR